MSYSPDERILVETRTYKFNDLDLIYPLSLTTYSHLRIGTVTAKKTVNGLNGAVVYSWSVFLQTDGTNPYSTTQYLNVTSDNISLGKHGDWAIVREIFEELGWEYLGFVSLSESRKKLREPQNA